MPFERPALTDLRNQVAQDINANLPGADALLRFSNLRVLGDIQAGLAHQHYGYLDWIARQTTPYTATDEYLEAWAALKNVIRKPASQATGTVTFPCADASAVIPNGMTMVRSDGAEYVVSGTVSQTALQIVISGVASADPAGLAGSAGNCQINTQFTLGQSIPSVTSTGTSSAFVGGADLENNDSLRARMLLAYQKPAQGGNAGDYVEWAMEVPGVTRAWTEPLIRGAGTVGVYIMLDNVNIAHDGYPQGANGVAAGEKRDASATGDQLIVADHIYPLRPVTALVYVLAPVNHPVNISISGIAPANRQAVQDTLRSQLVAIGVPGGKVEIKDLWAAIYAARSTDDFIISSPTADLTLPDGELPSLGAITWL